MAASQTSSPLIDMYAATRNCRRSFDADRTAGVHKFLLGNPRNF